jgi:hypothetical protein
LQVRDTLRSALFVIALGSALVARAGSSVGSFSGYAILSIGLAGNARSSTDVSFTFNPTICLPINNCQFQMIGDHAIRGSTDGGTMGLMQWGALGTHYRGIVSSPTSAGYCYFSTNTAGLYLIGYAVWPLAGLPLLPYSLGSDAWQSNSVCRVVENPCDFHPERPGCGTIDKENCPLLVNTGNGAWKLTGLDTPVRFDMDADGTRERMGWTAPDSSLSFLALDINGNGVIDNGTELFGEYMIKPDGRRAAHGFDALQQYDRNLDGRIDMADVVWTKILLWSDRDHDGVSQPGEMAPISQSEIIALETSYAAERRQDQFGNHFRLASTLHRTHGTDARYYDIFFVVERPNR